MWRNFLCYINACSYRHYAHLLVSILWCVLVQYSYVFRSVKPHTKTLSPVSPEKKVRDAPTFSIGAENQREYWLPSVQKNSFGNLAVGKKVKKKATAFFVFGKEKVLF
jgi:hypothetical protein